MRLNFQITSAASDKLLNYTAASSRSASDVIRQLLGDYLDGFRPLGNSLSSPEGVRRTNCVVSDGMVARLDRRIASLGYGASKGRVINTLLEEWSPDRAVESWYLLRDIVAAYGAGNTEECRLAITRAKAHLESLHVER